MRGLKFISLFALFLNFFVFLICFWLFDVCCVVVGLFLVFFLLLLLLVRYCVVVFLFGCFSFSSFLFPQSLSFFSGNNSSMEFWTSIPSESDYEREYKRFQNYVGVFCFRDVQSDYFLSTGDDGKQEISQPSFFVTLFLSFCQ